MNIGLFGGTFDLIHKGHLVLAAAERERCELGRIYYCQPARIFAGGGGWRSAREIPPKSGSDETVREATRCGRPRAPRSHAAPARQRESEDLCYRNSQYGAG